MQSSIIFQEIHSNPIIGAIKHIFYDEFINNTSTVFIKEQSTENCYNSYKPKDIVNEFLQIQDIQMTMAFVIENNANFMDSKYRRKYNLFIIDSYDGFR